MRFKFQIFIFLMSFVFIASCTQKPQQDVDFISNQTPLNVMEQIALNIKQCWFKHDKVEFRPYSLAPELASFTGRPRILIVPKNNPADRPLLVIEASGQPTKISTYGPLMSGNMERIIINDIYRWIKSDNRC